MTAEIYVWEYVDPQDPAAGKQQSTTLAPDGALYTPGPGLHAEQANLTQAYLIGADLSNSNLEQATLSSADLTDAKLRAANLTGAVFSRATLAGADLTDAEIEGVSFQMNSREGYFSILAAEQLYGTASYQRRELRGINFAANILNGWDLSNQDLADSEFYHARLENANLTGAKLAGATFQAALITNADFTGADLRDAYMFNILSFTPEQLYSTASYQQKDLSGITLSYVHLDGWNLAGQNLTGSVFQRAFLVGADLAGADLSDAYFYTAYLDNANLQGATLRGAQLGNAHLINTDLTNADIRGAGLQLATSYGFTAAQLYSTASYQSVDLSGIDFSSNDLTDWNFRGQRLTDTRFNNASLVNTYFDRADARGAQGLDLSTTTNISNFIQPDGHIEGVSLQTPTTLRIRDYDGSTPIPILVENYFAMSGDGTLGFRIDGADWGSTISFAPDIPVSLGGRISLYIAIPDPWTLVGTTFQLFDWTSVVPVGSFGLTAQLGTVWDTSQLYTTGEVTLSNYIIPADFDRDFDVDGGDFLSWQRGESPVPGSADDLELWHIAYGANVEAGTTSVPEPGNLILWLGVCSLLSSGVRATPSSRA